MASGRVDMCMCELHKGLNRPGFTGVAVSEQLRLRPAAPSPTLSAWQTRPIQILQNQPRDHPFGSDAVHPVSAVVAERGGLAP